MEHNVQLPDEYDDIYRDLEPFWGINPLYLQKTREDLETRNGTVVVEKTDRSPHIEVVSHRLPSDSAKQLTQIIRDILLLVEDIEHHLPPFRAVFSPHDGPSMVSDYRVKSMALAAAANGSSKLCLLTIEIMLTIPSPETRGFANSATVWLAIGLSSVFSSLEIPHGSQ